MNNREIPGVSMGQQEPPELARFEIKLFQWRLAKLLDPATGEYVGIKIEIYMTALPWLKIHLPFMRLEARHFASSITEVLDEITEESSSESEA